MGLNIKAADVEAMATELARLKGTTKTGAIRQALERELQDLRPDAGRDGKAERIMKIAREMRARMEDLGIDPSALNHDDLYDEDGMPA